MLSTTGRSPVKLSKPTFGRPETLSQYRGRHGETALFPNVRDGLTRVQRLVLYELQKARQETGKESIPTVMLYGRVVEHVPLNEMEFQGVLDSLGLSK